MKTILFTIAMLFINNVQAQNVDSYNESLIASASQQANTLIEQGNIDAAAQLYGDMIHLYKVNEGLYTTSTIDLAISLRQWAEDAGDLQEAYDWGAYLSFIAIKNDEAYVYLAVIEALLFDVESECFERHPDSLIRWWKNNPGCVELRYYRADSWIRATELQELAVEVAENKTEALELLYTLAGITATVVYRVDAGEPTFRRNGDYIEQVEQLEQPKYVSKRYYSLQRETLGRLMTGEEE